MRAAIKTWARGNPGDPLSNREREVLQLVLIGKSNKEIAADLGISYHSARFHVSEVLNKLSCDSRYEVREKFTAPKLDAVLILADLINRVRRLEELCQKS